MFGLSFYFCSVHTKPKEGMFLYMQLRLHLFLILRQSSSNGTIEYEDIAHPSGQIVHPLLQSISNSFFREQRELISFGSPTTILGFSTAVDSFDSKSKLENNNQLLDK